MISSRVVRWVAGCAMVSTAIVTPVRWSSDSGLIAAELACSDGTCCPEVNSECIINGISTMNAYRKTGPGSCKEPTQPAPPP